MALPEGYFTDDSDSEEGLSYVDLTKIKETVPVLEERKLLPGQKLINAILDRKLDEVSRLLEEEVVDVNCSSDNSGWTPLMYASSLGISEYVELLLKKGANPNYHDKLTTPLMCTCDSTCFNNDELLKCFNLLVEAGASINVCDSNKMTPLMLASCRGHIQLAARLLELGTDLEVCDNVGWTAIFFAVNSGDANMVQMLKDAGSNLTLIDVNGRSLYNLAMVKNYLVIADMVNIEKKITADAIQQKIILNDKLTKYQLIMHDMPNYEISDFNGFVQDSLKTIIAAGLSNLITLFTEKKIGYAKFLTFQDEDWKNIGVEMSFDRKKLTSFAKKVVQKKWSQDAFIKQSDGNFSLFNLIQNVSNAVRIIHILIATCYICQRELQNADTASRRKIEESLNNCIRELYNFKIIITRLKSFVENIHKSPPPDFIGPSH